MRLFGNKKKEKNGYSQIGPPTGTVSSADPNENGMLGRLRSGLRKTHDKITGGLQSVLKPGARLDEDTLEQIEEQLYLADIGPRTVERICSQLHEACRDGELADAGGVIPFLKERIKADLRPWETGLKLPAQPPAVLLVAGVNGSGKTTTIGKMAMRFQKEGKSVLLAACDTFRAAAGEQLEIWAEWTGADIVKNESADPASVAFDAMDKALSRNYDVLIIDTAGRVHTRENLMSELSKIQRVVSKKLPEAPHETLMVLDANTGQNGLSQAVRFNEYLELTGLVLAKLDGTARGGIVFGMRDQIDVPVKFVGIGQQPEDLAPFDPDKFVDAMFE